MSSIGLFEFIIVAVLALIFCLPLITLLIVVVAITARRKPPKH